MFETHQCSLPAENEVYVSLCSSKVRFQALCTLIDVSDFLHAAEMKLWHPLDAAVTYQIDWTHKISWHRYSLAT